MFIYGKKKGYALSALMIALLVISLAIVVAIPVLSIKKDTFTNTSVYVKDCIAKEGTSDLNSTACTGAITGLTKGFNKDYESVLYYLNDATFTADTLKIVKESCDDGGERACIILLDRCASGSDVFTADTCDISGIENDLNNYITMPSSDTSNLGKTYLATKGVEYYLHRMTNFNNVVETVCNADMTTMACDIAAETKTKIYNLNSPQRSDFYESNSTTGTQFHDGIVDLMPDGSSGPIAYGWGYNYRGILGDGTETTRATPTLVSGGLSFSQLATGDNQSCGLTTTGEAYCWGSNSNGAIGDGTTTHRLVPTAVSGGLTFSQIATGGGHTCGITTTGVAYCWGSNNSGRLGDGTTTDRWVPTAVSGGLTFSQISTGVSHTCGVTTTGAGYCWGYNAGFLGDGTTTAKSVPTSVSGGLTFSEISAGNSHSCGLTTTGEAYCWGYNTYGQVGDGTTDHPRLVPVAVTGSLIFSKISAGNIYSCGLTTAGTAYCWGYNGPYGKIGDGSTVTKLVPTAVSGGLTFSQIDTGSYSHSCGVTTTGAAYCWGYNNYGQIGDNTIITRKVPTAVSGGLTFSQISAGYYTTLGLTSNARNSAYITTTDVNNITNIIGGIKSFTISAIEPSGTKIRGLISFDGRANWKKWNGSAWVQAATAAELPTYNFATSGNANTTTEIETNLMNHTTGVSSLDFAIYLETDSTGLISPSIDTVSVVYLKER